MHGSSLNTTVLYPARIIPSFLVFLHLHLLEIHFVSPLAYTITWLLSNAAGLLLSRIPLRFILKAAIALLMPLFLTVTMFLFASDSFLLDFEFFIFLNAPVITWNIFFSSQSKYGTSLRFELMALPILLSLFFILNPPHTLPLYQKPVILSLVLFLLSASILAGLGLSWFPEHHLERKERQRFYLAAILIPLLVVILTLRPLENNASKQGGGLIQPNLFSFDFSPFIKLQSEISMSDELVMIVHKEQSNNTHLARRFILSAYDQKSGFFMDEERDPAEHPASLPPSPVVLEYTTDSLRSLLSQTYYIINFDPRAFMAINQPTRIEPYHTWSNSSFSSVYRVESMATEALPFELLDSDFNDTALPHEEHYLEYGNDERIHELALSITEGLSSTWERVQAVHDYLQKGDYRYSLKPGIAADGNQLHYFLFDVKKGYCTYYAFSMTLLLRSIGIASRVAAGFILDEESSALSYYPVRANMAHAWVEVWFKNYGWIEFDPTSTQLAEGEEYAFSSEIDPDLFSRLIEEINTYSELLQIKNENPSNTTETSLASKVLNIVQKIFKWRFLWLFISYLFFMLWIRLRHYLHYRLAKRAERKLRALLAHCLLRLRFAGIAQDRFESLHQFAERLPPELKQAFASLMELRDHSLFAPDRASAINAASIKECYMLLRLTINAYTKLPRRMLSWIAPPVLLLRKTSAIIFLCIGMMIPARMDAQEMQTGLDSSILLDRAREEIRSEFWDAAIKNLQNGKDLFPEDPRFAIELGDLYSDKELYSLAWKEYQQAESITPNDALLQYKLALTAGYLNQENLSVSYLEKVVQAMPDDVDRHADLAWAYYKIHRAASGIRLLKEFETRQGETSAFYMTYGTLYADEKDFPNAKRYYERSIQDSQRRRQEYVESIAHYNYSLVLNQFHFFDEAFEQTGQSIEAYDRPSGRLAKGEMLIRQGEYLKAKDEFQQAWEGDKSPLSKMALADIYQRAGDLVQAEKWIDLVLKHEDQAWMYNYGTNINQHKNFLHSIAHYIYDGLYKSEAFTIHIGLGERISGLKKRLEHAIKARYHQLVYKMYARNSAKEFESEAMLMDAFKNYFYAYEHHDSRSLYYLERAESIETGYIPKEKAVYRMEKALLAKDAAAIQAAMEELDPIWHRDLIIRAWTVLAQRDPDAAISLYSLHPGILLPNNIILPAVFTFTSETGTPGILSRIQAKKVLKHAGFRASNSSRYEIALYFSRNALEWSVTDRLSGRVLSSGKQQGPVTKYKTIALALQRLQKDVFTLK